MKTAIIAGAALGILHGGAAIAGPYVNIEANSGFSGSDYTGSLLENHLGYEGELGESSSWYLQGGPAVSFVDDEDSTTELSGKVGLSTAVSESVDVYGEYWAMTGDELASNVKAGVKWSF